MIAIVKQSDLKRGKSGHVESEVTHKALAAPSGSATLGYMKRGKLPPFQLAKPYATAGNQRFSLCLHRPIRVPSSAPLVKEILMKTAFFVFSMIC